MFGNENIVRDIIVLEKSKNSVVIVVIS